MRVLTCQTCRLEFHHAKRRGRTPRNCPTCTPQKPTFRPGFLFYEGPSSFTGTTIRAFIRHPLAGTLNEKTGPDVDLMTIVPAFLLPRKARKTGRDDAVCGDCALRPRNGGGCYVRMFPGPESTAYAHNDRPYPMLPDVRIYEGRTVRAAEWGDPAALPIEAWRPLLEVATVLAYTHAWRRLDPKVWGWCMASCEWPEQAEEAERLGWRVYRTRRPGDPLRPGERMCPAAEEAPGHGRVTCSSCRACDGNSSRHRRSYAIIAHGQSWRRVHQERLLAT